MCVGEKRTQKKGRQNPKDLSSETATKQSHGHGFVKYRSERHQRSNSSLKAKSQTTTKTKTTKQTKKKQWWVFVVCCLFLLICRRGWIVSGMQKSVG